MLLFRQTERTRPTSLLAANIHAERVEDDNLGGPLAVIGGSFCVGLSLKLPIALWAQPRSYQSALPYRYTFLDSD